jgi:penicillin-insensitive murein endopeptidase
VVSVTAPAAEAAPSVSEPPRAEKKEDVGRYFPFLPDEDPDASISIGDTSHGYLVGSAELVENDAVGILPVQKERGLRYGTRAIVEMIQSAGRALHAETKTRLWIGNIGKRDGGDITWSVSHNSGRDADIAFCYMNKNGKPKDPPDLVPLNGQGLAAGQDLRLDPKRTWIVIKALLAYPKAQVQYLFMADGLKSQVLMHASNSGESPALVKRAAAVIRQPSGSAPHNDHLHLRIFCGEQDVLGGCRNTGAIHPWTDLYTAERKRFVERTADLLEAPEPTHRKRAIERLALLDAREAADDIADMLAAEKDHEGIRKAAARSLARLGGPAQVPLLAKHFRRERDAAVRIAITQAIGDIGGREAGRFLAHAVGEPRREPANWSLVLGAAADLGGPTFLPLLPDAAAASRDAIFTELLGLQLSPSEDETAALAAQLAAIGAAAKSERTEPMGPLIGLLSDTRPIVRERAAHALRMISNLTYYIPWRDGAPRVLDRGRKRWQMAYQRSKGAPRDAWLATGFQAAGFKVPELNQSRTWELVRAIAGSDHISYNAQRVLMRLLKHHPPSLRWSKGAACMHWYKWVRARRKSFKLGRPPQKAYRACSGTP